MITMDRLNHMIRKSWRNGRAATAIENVTTKIKAVSATLSGRWNSGMCLDRKYRSCSQLLSRWKWIISLFRIRACRQCQNGVYADCYRPGCVFADGIERGIMTAQRQVPGPAIHVRSCGINTIDSSKNHIPHWCRCAKMTSSWST